MLVDADVYFQAAREAMLAARHSILLLSWDIDSRMRLVPAGTHDGYPEQLGDFLHALVSEREGLDIWLLNWDFTMLYAMEREWLPVLKLGWATHRRLHFFMDAHHPIGASHHQKIIVVDDAIAFVGGLDLTGARWDTPEHRVDNPLRTDRDGKPYAPFHDVQAAVDGEAARALGKLCRTRWLRATGVLPEAPSGQAAGSGQCWPGWLEPDLVDVDVGISRTEPAFEGGGGVQEVRRLHLDAIAAASQSLLFENQYFTSGLIADALEKRLGEPAPPEVIVITPMKQSGWLEEVTMGVLRARVHARLRSADSQQRYRLVCPMLPDQNGQCLNVHSKLLFVDTRLCSIGSANLSNRSMACDTECNLSIEASGREAARIADGIARLRARLLAEHLGTTPAQVRQVLDEEEGSVSRTIDALYAWPRCLQDVEPSVPPELDALIPQQALFDPERPIDPEKAVVTSVPKEAHASLPWRFAGLVLLSLLLIGLALAWRYTPMREYLNLPALIGLAQRLRDLPATPVLVVLAYVIGGLLMVPVTLLIAATGIVFGFMPGALYALAGALGSAGAGYALGALLGRDVVRRLLGARINRLSRQVARRGIIAMIVLRSLPLAPYGVVNVVSGASHIRLRDYLLGTALGMLPGILLTTAFAHNLVMAIRRPSLETLGVLVIVVLLLSGFGIGMRKWIRRQRDS